MSNKIKVLYTIPNFDTAGSGRVVYDLVKGLDKEIFSPEICCEHNRGDFFKEIESLKVPIHIYKFVVDYRPIITLPFRILRIAKFFRKHKFDIIHSWHWSSDFTEPLAAKIAGIPWIYTKKAMGWGNKPWQWRTKLSTRVIAINKDMLELFFGPYKKKTTYMPLGVDLQKFKPIPEDSFLKHTLNISDRNFVILTIANLVPVKGIEILLEGVLMLKNPNVKLLIVGADHSDYAKELKSKYTDPEFYFLGKQVDVRPYISIADLFVIPTLDEGRKEGLPIAPLEAMAMGKIVVGSNISGIKDLLSVHQEYLFESGNVEQLSNIIDTIIGYDIQRRESEGSKMLRTVEKTFTLEECLERHSDLYCKMISRT